LKYSIHLIELKSCPVLWCGEASKKELKAIVKIIKMLRTSATRLIARNTHANKLPIFASSYSTITSKIHPVTSLHISRDKRPQSDIRLKRSSPGFVLSISTIEHPIDKINREAERKTAEQKLRPTPEIISTSSSVRQVFEESQTNHSKDDEVARDLKADLRTVKETFSLKEVPRESLYLGLAGVLPYVATSLSTLLLTYNVNNAHSFGAIFAPETARHFLDLIVPMQIGYGAVIISFLGAIHWGLEYAGYGGHQGYYRFLHGVIPTAVAWPTLLMPVEYALITQFLAFSALYFSDARATVRGWFPPWYNTYRFLLTLLVGLSIGISLVGRGQIVRHDGTFKDPVGKLESYRDAQRKALETEQAEMRKEAIRETTKAKGKDETKDPNDNDSRDNKDDNQANEKINGGEKKNNDDAKEKK